MKQTLLFACAAFLLIGCQPATTSTENKDSSSAAAPATAATTYDYAYTIEHPDNWTPGNQQHVVTALKGLKAFENGDIAACVATFADSVRIEFDQMEATLSNDSLKGMFTKFRSGMKDLKIKMEDWESVISKDKKVEYVSLWYKQIWTDQKGKIDSVECMDDLRIKDGKIASLNEKTRRYAVKK